jgi:cyclophilin family peptidyl-prolyl cis-trans isomerase
MDAIIETAQKTIAIELANAIAPFDINKVADLLKEDGEYSIQD